MLQVQMQKGELDVKYWNRSYKSKKDKEKNKNYQEPY